MEPTDTPPDDAYPAPEPMVLPTAEPGGVVHLAIRRDLMGKGIIVVPFDEGKRLLDRLARALTDVVKEQAADTASSILYAALFSVPPDHEGVGGVELTPEAAPGYTRAMVFFENRDDGTTANREIVWPQPAEEDWPAAVALGFFGSPVGDEWAILPPHYFGGPVGIVKGGTPQLSAGIITTLQDA